MRSRPRSWAHLRGLLPGSARRVQNRRLLTTSAADDLDGSGRVIFSGIQPTGVPHLGNYLGALRQWVRLQDTAPEGTRLLYSVVDLHAFTSPTAGGPNIEASDLLRRRRRETLAALLAIGLDPERSVLFYQSSVSPLAILPGTRPGRLLLLLTSSLP